MAARKHLVVVHSILFCVLLMAAHKNAGAEGYLDLYGGGPMNTRADVNVSETSSSGTRSASASIDLSSSTEFGMRFGVWGDTIYNWVGMGIDLGYLQADGPGVDITALPFTLFLAVRAPLLPTPERPGGRLQPYAMAGVSFYISDLSVQLDGMGGSSYQVSWPMPFSVNSTEKVYGPYLAAGLAWQATKSLAVFGEYRYSSFDVDFDTTNSFLFPTANGRVETTIRSDRILFGLSHRFGAGTPGKEANQ